MWMQNTVTSHFQWVSGRFVFKTRQAIWLADWFKVFVPNLHEIGHFGDILSGKSLSWYAIVQMADMYVCIDVQNYHTKYRTEQLW